MLETLVSLKIHYGKTAASTEVPQKSTIRLVLPKKLNTHELPTPQLHKFRPETSNLEIIESIKPVLNLKNNFVLHRPSSYNNAREDIYIWMQLIVDRLLILNKWIDKLIHLHSNWSKQSAVFQFEQSISITFSMNWILASSRESGNGRTFQRN